MFPERGRHNKLHQQTSCLHKTIEGKEREIHVIPTLEMIYQCYFQHVSIYCQYIPVFLSFIIYSKHQESR